MSDERQSASLNDSSATEIDRELAQLLSIAPSAEFVPRVQRRIRTEAALRPSRMPWWIRVAAAATVVLAILLGSRVWRTQRVTPEVRIVGITKQPPSVMPPAHQAAAPLPQPPRIAGRRPKRVPPVPEGRREAGSTQADVVVSRDQLRAIARLQELVAHGDLTDKNSPPTGSIPEALTDIRPAPLAIAPLTVSVVEVITGGEGSRARLERYKRRRRCEMRNRTILAALLAMAIGGAGYAQEPAAASAPQSGRAQSAALVGVKVQVVISRYQGEKKLGSLPYVLGVLVNGAKTSLRMGVDVPVTQTVFSSATKDGPATVPTKSYSYRTVGTNIDCQAQSGPDGSYKLFITVTDSSVQLDSKDLGNGLAPDLPMFRSFNSSFQVLLRDGQSTQYTSATDPVSGELTKIDVTLNLAK
ncbi:MAG: hypothetical protein ACRD1V_15235 [Vicinamibacterales bacterium]